jgi:hypothetical protein
MTIPSLNGNTPIALSLTAVLGVLGVAGKFYADRLAVERAIAENALLIKQLQTDLVNGTYTRMAPETRTALEALDRRLDRIEKRLDGEPR